MMQLISQDHYGEFVEELADMHRLRYRVFKQRLDWEVEVSGDLEVDQFDALHPIYLLQRSRDGRVQGCVRLLPSTGPTMLRDTFGMLLNGEPVPTSPSSLVENPSAAPRIGRSSEWRPLPASRKAVENRSAKIGRIWRAKGAP